MLKNKKIKIKYISAYIGCLILLCSFCILCNVQGDVYAAQAIPEVSEIIYEDSFTGTTLSSNIVKLTDKGDLKLQNSALNLSRSQDSRINAVDEARIYLNSDKSGERSEFTAIDFTIKRELGKLCEIALYDEADTELVTLRLQSDNTLSAYSRDENGMLIFTKLKTNIASGAKLRITVSVNHISGKVNIWVDGNIALDDGFCLTGSDNIACLSVSLPLISYQSVEIDDFKAYKCYVGSGEVVDMDYSCLDFDDITKENENDITAKLKLPSVGENGSVITWTSEPSGYVLSDGSLNRDPVSDKSIKLIANISHGSSSLTKEFNIVLKRKTENTLPTALGEYIVNDTMTSGRFNSQTLVQGGTPRATDKGIELKKNDLFSYLHDTALTDNEPIAFEFKLAGDDTRVDFYDDDNTVCYSIKKENNELFLNTTDLDTGVFVCKKLKTGLSDEGKYTILIDPLAESYSVWHGDDKYALAVDAISSLNKLYKVSFSGLDGVSYVSDYRVYLAKPSLEDMAEFDYDYLELDRLTWQAADNIIEDFELPLTGNAGSSISWTSTDSSAIRIENGVAKVANPSASAKSLTLTATINPGSAAKTKTKSFSLSCPVFEECEMPEARAVLGSDDFKRNHINTTWVDEPYDGAIAVKGEQKIITRSTNTKEEGSNTSARYYFNENQTTIQGVYSLEFTIERTEAKQILMRVLGSSDFMALNWSGDGSIKAIYSEDISSNGTSHDIGNYQGKIKINALFDTARSTYSLWINNENIFTDKFARFPDHGGIRQLRVYIEGTNYTSVIIDDIEFCEAYTLSKHRVAEDKAWLEAKQIVSPDDDAFLFGSVSRDLILPTKGYYGSNISWSSDKEYAISSDGRVNLGASYEEVTLTAAISSRDTVDTKDIVIKLIPDVSDEAEAVREDMAALTLSTVAKADGGTPDICHSLNLVDKGTFGSSIVWKSSDTNYITSSGRVITPKAGEGNKKVTLTATVSKGQYSLEKVFEFNVLADSSFTDPMEMSDEEFFGVWNGRGWTTESKWNYDYASGLKAVEEAVKKTGTSGDYTKAKEALLSYFQNSRTPLGKLSMDTRNTGWADMIADDFQHLQRSGYYKGNLYISNEWNSYTGNISTEDIEVGNNVSFSVRSWYTESSYAHIWGARASDMAMRPRLELTVNGLPKTVYASDSVQIRGGSYKNTNYKDMDCMQIRTFGEFLGDDTSYAILKFNLSDLTENDKVTSARLVLYAKSVPAFSGEKRLIVLREPSNAWSSDTARWTDFTGYIYSFNGYPEVDRWAKREAADSEYLWQACRFYAWNPIAVEYKLTKNEDYAYRAIRIMQSFMKDTAYWRSSTTGYTYDAAGIRGGYPRSLDVATGRLSSWTNTIDTFFKSKYATADFCTAVMKNLYNGASFLTQIQTDYGNWHQHENNGLLEAAAMMPEFKEAPDWANQAKGNLEQMLFENNLADGSYVEACTSYAIGAFEGFVNFKAELMSSGSDTSKAYSDLLHKAAYYQLALFAPDGTSLSYGDSSESTRPNVPFEQVYRWFDDKELEYITSYGARGEKPSWTSQHFPLSTVAALRASWDKDSPYLFINARGGGQHGHNDYNGILLHAYGRTLLNDAGIFTYTATDPYRKWGLSSKAHNTVLINDTSQKKDGNAGYVTTGKVYGFNTNSNFDWLSQSTPQTKGFEHRRTIMYIKPDIYIVSDLIDPEDNSGLNNYRQLWHMLPNANIGYNEDNMTIFSNYNDGANIIIASADKGEAALREEMGWYTRRYQVIEDAPFAYFEKANAVGDTSLDSVIMINKDDATAKIEAARLSTKESATALSFNFTKNGSDYEGFYYQSYDGSGASFGDYVTDAETAYVQLNSEGNIYSIMLRNGSYIKKSDGTVIFESASKLSEFSAEMSGSILYLTTTDADKMSDIKIIASKEYTELRVNELEKSFTKKDSYVYGIGTTDESTSGSADTPRPPSQGIIDDNTSSASGGAGGAGGGGGMGTDDSSDATDIPKPDDEKVPGDEGDKPDEQTPPIVNIEKFTDIDKHWAKADIEYIRSLGIVNGDGTGKFNPDNNITRAEFLAMVIRSLGAELATYQMGFYDVHEDMWFADVVQTALDLKIISPDKKFRPGDYITREEMAKIISIAASLPKGNGRVDSYTDHLHISPWAREYVSAVREAGIMSGNPDGSFAPLNNASRAECAAVICRMMKM